MTRLGAHITDHALIAARDARALREAEAAGRRTYVATWADGHQERFAVGHSEAAAVFAREYAARILHREPPIHVRWDR